MPLQRDFHRTSDDSPRFDACSALLVRAPQAWVRDWELGSLDRREARLRCTVILPTICAAAAAPATLTELRSSWVTWGTQVGAHQQHEEVLAVLRHSLE